MSGSGSEVHLVRGERVESRHALHAAVVGLGDARVDATDAGRAADRDSSSPVPPGEASLGDPGLGAYWRSSMKPFQALPLVADGAAGALGLGPAQIAVCCASHAGTPEHVELVAGVLEKLGLGEEELHCAPHPPFDRSSARETLRSGAEYSRLQNNCSGKHAGMLALAAHHGWPLEGYVRPDHPVQARIRRELGRWLEDDIESLRWATDGCGVPTPWLPLRSMARAWARLGTAGRSGGGGDPGGPGDSVRDAAGETAPAAARTREAARAVVSAMRDHPDVVAGPGRFTTRLMRATGGRLLAKEGAEGVVCVAGPEEGWGLALKVGDGARRAVAPATVRLLGELDLLVGDERERLSDLERKVVTNVQGERVGELTAHLEPLAPVGRGVSTAGEE